MSEIIERLFDPYSRQARLYPALLTLLPIVAAYCVWFPPDESTKNLIVGFAAGVGLLYLLSDFARTCGKRIEPKLIKAWGGWPTTILLQHADTGLTSEVKRRYHDILAKLLGVAALPTAGEEREEPERADERYESAVASLRARCRGASYPLVEKENANYGFRRNLLGLKPYGMALALAPLFIPALASLWNIHDSIASSLRAVAASYLGLEPAALGTFSLSVVAAIIWIVVVTPDWVRAAGFQYARALISCCDVLAG